MGQKQTLFIAILLGAIMLFAGCAAPVPSDDSMVAGRNGTLNLSAYSRPSEGRELAGPTPCTCMLCTNYSSVEDASLLERLLNLIGLKQLETSLLNGNCSFSACNSTMFADILLSDSPELTPRYFMLGQGSSGGEYSLAQRYCNGSLTMPVVWAVGNSTEPANPLSRSSAECFLLRNQMPVVVIYNNDPALPMDVSVWSDAAKSYGSNSAAAAQAGPVVITTEALFNSSDPAALERVKNEIDAIKQNCPKCLVALAPSDRDWEGVDYFLNSSRLNYSQYIDVVGLGFITNDNAAEKECSPSASLGLRQRFSYEILRSYRKPSVWYAVGIANGTTSMQGCRFTPVMVRGGWEWVGRNIRDLAASGIIGVAPYRYLDGGAQPLYCDGSNYSCDFGFKDADSNQKNQSFFGWFSMCEFYATDSTSTGVRPIVNSSQQPVIFSTNGLGVACGFADMNKMGVMSSVISGGSPPSPKIPDPDAKLQERVAALTCGACMSDVAMPKSFCYRAPPSFPSDACTAYQQVDEAVLLQNFDPLFMRAIIMGESNFDNCAVSANTSPTSPCGQQKDRTVLEFYARAKAPGSSESFCPTDLVYDRAGRIADAGNYVCALGIAQCTENPGEVDKYTRLCGGKNYNPFNPYDSFCCGTSKAKDYFEISKTELAASLRRSSSLRALVKPGEEDWYAAWLSMRRYLGDGPTAKMMEDYASTSGATADGMVQYIDNTAMTSKPYYVRQYATNVILRYNKALNVCGGGCPYQKCSG